VNRGGCAGHAAFAIRFGTNGAGREKPCDDAEKTGKKEGETYEMERKRRKREQMKDNKQKQK